ncbi:MAG: alpha/beta fold hydrolase [Methylovirgula sp.]|uniref:alpha/beta hydrolase n=1 Tax=Methylovirgula sp. TaxID=1978224 RepID=UPI003076624E
MSDSDAFQVASAIVYRSSRRPDGLSSDFDEKLGTSLVFYTLRALDGGEIAAALWQPLDKPVSETILIIMIHGSGGSFRRPPESALGGALAELGYASLAIDTRQHDGNINTDNFFDTVRDIQAAVYTARALGYRSIVLQGHSLGNIQVQYYAASNWDSDIKGVILLAAFGNLPWKTRTILVQDETRFRALIDAAIAAKRDGDISTPLPVAMRYFSGQDSSVTARHFLTYRWDKSSVADGTYWIKRVPYPILLVRDSADALILPFEPQMLLDAANAEGSLVASIELATLPNKSKTSLEAHYFAHTIPALANTIANWIAGALAT